MNSNIKFLLDSIQQQIAEIKKDPILNALVEKDILGKLSKDVETMAQHCSDDIINMLHTVESLKDKIEDLECNLESLRYENDRLNEQLYS